MSFSTEHLAQACARRPWLTLGAWLLALVVGIALVATFLDLTTEGNVTSNPESQQGYSLINRHLAPDPNADWVDELVVVHSASRTVRDPVFRRRVRRLLTAIVLDPGVHNSKTVYSSGDRSLVAHDRHATVIPVGLQGDCEASADAVMDIVQRSSGDGFDVAMTGNCSADSDVSRVLNHDLARGELAFGIPAALVILVLVFGALVAAVVPLTVALFSIAISLGISALFSQVFDLSVYLLQMTTVMGLAIATDYGFFIVSRYREERSTGREKLDAIAASGATASRAVLFSGFAFVLAMCGLLLVPDSVLRSLGVGALTVGLVSVFAALTLVPALLGLLGDRVNALRVPLLGAAVDSAGREGRFWSRIARTVMRRPGVSLVLCAALLLAAAAPVLDLRLSGPGVRSLPDSAPSKQGFRLLQREFGAGTVDSVKVAVEGDVTKQPLRSAVERLVADIRANPDFRFPQVTTSPDKRLVLVEALPVGDSRDRSSLAALKELRNDEVPKVFGDTGASVRVTGETAEEVDYTALMDFWLPRIIAFVLGLSFVLLTIAFRSVVLAVKAILLNLLSVAAAYGLLVLVFQEGVGNGLLGFHHTPAVTTWVPLFLFTVLFGLSMDYHVFLLSRIRERYLRTGLNEEAVSHSLATTARVITGAALIIIAVFVGFATGQIAEIQQVGFGVGVALLIDATLVRCVLVPASMKLLGRWNWYLPSWLGWLPDPHVEHEAAHP